MKYVGYDKYIFCYKKFKLRRRDFLKIEIGGEIFSIIQCKKYNMNSSKCEKCRKQNFKTF